MRTEGFFESRGKEKTGGRQQPGFHRCAQNWSSILEMSMTHNCKKCVKSTLRSVAVDALNFGRIFFPLQQLHWPSLLLMEGNIDVLWELSRKCKPLRRGSSPVWGISGRWESKIPNFWMIDPRFDDAILWDLFWYLQHHALASHFLQVTSLTRPKYHFLQI